MFIGVGASLDAGYIGANEKTGHAAEANEEASKISYDSGNFTGETTNNNQTDYISSHIKIFTIVGVIVIVVGGFLVYKFA